MSVLVWSEERLGELRCEARANGFVVSKRGASCMWLGGRGKTSEMRWDGGGGSEITFNSFGLERTREKAVFFELRFVVFLDCD